MQDPNGIIFHKGRYHVFYQYDPTGQGGFYTDDHWGHAVSKDLLHWEHLPDALSPTPGGPDRHGCWSGCLFMDNDTPTILYTGLVRKTDKLEERISCLSQCLATSSDDMLTWEKYPGNPVLADPPIELGKLTAWHDPYVWREGDAWYMVLGCAFRDGPGAVLLYRSSDLVHWGYLHPLCVGEKVGERWLVPKLIPMGNKHILLYYLEGITRYIIGTYKKHRFTSDIQGQFDYFQAGGILADAQGQRMFWGWIGEDRNRDVYQRAGWAGMATMPRVMELKSDGAFTMYVSRELWSSGTPDWEYKNEELSPSTPFQPAELRGDCLEIRVDIELGQAEVFGIKVRCSPGGEEETLILYNRSEQRLSLDRTRSSLDPAANLGSNDARLALAADEPLRLHIFLDRSVVEVFACRRASLAGRIYPARHDSGAIALFAQGHNAIVQRLRVWKRESIWEEKSG